MKLRLDCLLCKIYVDMPLKQFKKGVGGLFLDDFKCVNCQNGLSVDLVFND